MIVKEREQKEDVRPSVEFARDIRSRLAQSFLERPALAPQNPDSVEFLMQKSKNTVSERWRQSVSDLVREKASVWIPTINPDVLEQKLTIRQFSDLDFLRKINPEAWYSLVRTSMERQQAETNLLYQWARDCSDADFSNLGIGRLELLTALEIAAKTGPLINETYMKQMELLDNPQT